ncbi:MAG: methyl-accepting chemotaxis protein [Granulosicoccus sp.]
MKLENIGIRKKLLSAFFLVLGTTLLASGVSNYAFSQLSESLNRITNHSVPLMGKSITVTQLAAELNGLLILLSGSTSDSQRQQHLDAIHAVIDSLRELSETSMQSAEVTSKSNQTTDTLSISASLDVKETKIRNLNLAVQERIKLSNSLKELTEIAVTRHYQLDDQLVQRIATASKKFVDLAEDTFTKNSIIIDTMLDEHLQSMFNALRLKVQVAEVATALANSLNTNTAERYSEDIISIQKSITVMNLYRQKLINKHIARRKNLDPALDYFNSLVSPESEIFRKPFTALSDARRNKLIENVRVTEKTIYRSVDPAIDVGHAMIYMSGNNLNTSVKRTLPTLMTKGVDNLVKLLQTRAEMNTLNGLLSRIPQSPTDDDLSSLEQQYSASYEKISDLLVSFTDEPDTNTLMSGIRENITLALGTNGGFDLKQQALKIQKNTEFLNRDIANNNISFKEILVANVENSKGEVSLSSTHIDQLISRSRWQLAFISVASMLFTFLVYWIVISRNLLSRLLTTIAALRSLADGNNNVTVDCRGSDELGMLAHTVDIFRSNSVKAENLQAEQAILAEKQREKDEHVRTLEQENHRKEMERSKLESQKANRQKEMADRLQKRVDNLLLAVSAASKGDLGYPINTAGDDAAGQMGRALGDFFSELKTNMSHINDNANRMTKASEGLTNLSINMKDIANSNSENSEEASRLANDVGSNVNNVSNATEQMSSSIQKITTSTSEAEIIANEAVSLTEATDSTVRKLAESSERIGSVVKVITSIAEQTNLLALNATIEAARAGVAGKGFAVVANEVKELAKGTAGATDQIESRIIEIQEDTNSAVAAIASISKTINKISTIQSTISVAVQEQSSVTREISGSVSNTASSTEAITTVIGGVASKANLSKNASVEINDAATDLTNMASQLQSLVSRYMSDDSTHRSSS